MISSQSVDAFQIKNSGGTELVAFNETGELIFNNITDIGDYDVQSNKGVWVSNVGASENGLVLSTATGSGNTITIGNSVGTNWIISATGMDLIMNSPATTYFAFGGTAKHSFTSSSLLVGYGSQLTADINLHVMAVNNAATNAIGYVAKFDHDYFPTGAVAGGGTGVEFETSGIKGGTIAIQAIDVTGASEDYDFVFRTIRAGTLTESLRILSTGHLKIDAITQDDAETKVVVWNSTDKVLEWRDASTLGGGSGGHTIRDEGSDMTARTGLNFIGAFIVTDDAGGNETEITLDADLETWAGITPASGMGTFIATPSSANLRGTITDENGTGALLFSSNTSATFTTPVIDGAATGTGVASIATASTLVIRDANANFAANNVHVGYTTTATAGGTTTLTIASTRTQFFTGSTTQNCDLPVVSTLPLGTTYNIFNNSTGNVTVRSSGGNTVFVLAAQTAATIISTATTGTDATVWGGQYIGLNFTAGKKITVNNTIQLSGTDGTTMTFPSTSATIARTDAGQTFTGVQTFSSAPVIGSITNTGTLTLPTVTSTVSSYKEASITSNATWSPSGDARENFYDITAQAAAATTVSAPSGTPANHNVLTIRVEDNGTARGISGWDAIYRAGTNLALPTTTTLGKNMYIRFIYNSNDSTWDLIAVIDGI